jgi:hypothetical protein
MGRNNHNKFRGAGYHKRKFSIQNVRVMVDRIQKSDDTPVVLNGFLLIFPWAWLFGSGTVASSVYVVNTQLDTVIFVGGGVLTAFLLLAVALLWLPKRRKDKK